MFNVLKCNLAISGVFDVINDLQLVRISVMNCKQYITPWQYITVNAYQWLGHKL